MSETLSGIVYAQNKMKELYNFFNTTFSLHEGTWNVVKNIFSEHSLKKGEYYVEEGKIAKKFG